MLNELGQQVAGQAEEHHDTTPPQADAEFEADRAADRAERIERMVQQVLPKVKARNVGHDPRQPWLSNPHMEATVRATIEELYDLHAS